MGTLNTSGTPIGGYILAGGNNISDITQRGAVEVIYSTQNLGEGGFNVFGFNGTTNTRYLKVTRSGNLMLQNGGVYSDTTERLQVTGASKFTGNVTITTLTSGYLTRASTGGLLTNSLVYDNGTSVLVNTATAIGGYTHSFQVAANAAGGIIVSATDTASAIGIVNTSSANKTWDISPFGNDLVINESGLATRMKFKSGGNIEVPSLAGTGSRMVVADAAGVMSTQAIPTGSVTGSGLAGLVAFWTGASTQSGSGNLFWDSSTNRLGVGTDAPADPIEIRQNSGGGVYARIRNTNPGSGSNAGLNLINDASKTGGVYLFSSAYTPSGVFGHNTVSLFGGPDTNISVSVNSTGYFSIGTGSTVTEKFRMYNNGNVAIQNGGTFTDDGVNRLQVAGNGIFNGKLSANNSVPTTGFPTTNTIALFGAQTLNIPATTIGASGVVYAAGTSANYMRFNGNTTMNGDALFAGKVVINSIQFDTTGTVTMSDSQTNGIRALSGLQVQMQAAGATSGTVTKGASILVQGAYPNNTAGTVTFTDYYGIRINNLLEWDSGTTANRIAMTNRWGIFQAGADDRNHFNGMMLIGTATAGGSKIRVSGLPTSATGLSVGDVWNDAGTLKIVI
jgi:hypothetical protein